MDSQSSSDSEKDSSCDDSYEGVSTNIICLQHYWLFILYYLQSKTINVCVDDRPADRTKKPKHHFYSRHEVHLI